MVAHVHTKILNRTVTAGSLKHAFARWMDGRMEGGGQGEREGKGNGEE